MNEWRKKERICLRQKKVQKKKNLSKTESKIIFLKKINKKKKKLKR